MRSEVVLVTDWKTLFQCCCLSSGVFLDGDSTRTLPGIELPTLHSFRLVWSSVLLPKAWYCLAWPRGSSLIFSGTMLLPRTPYTCYSSGAFLSEKVWHPGVFYHMARYFQLWGLHLPCNHYHRPQVSVSLTNHTVSNTKWALLALCMAVVSVIFESMSHGVAFAELKLYLIWLPSYS